VSAGTPGASGSSWTIGGELDRVAHEIGGAAASETAATREEDSVVCVAVGVTTEGLGGDIGG
jgi:hypothetical protein